MILTILNLRSIICSEFLLVFLITHNDSQALSLENLDTNLTLSVNLISPIGETLPMPLFVPNNFGNFLSHQFKISNELKNEKPYLLVDKRDVKVTNIFDCSSNIDDFGDKKFISIKVCKIHLF